MKIYDCFMFSDEKMLLNLRLKCLEKFVDKFIIVEADYYHNGQPKKLNFNINDFKSFKHKIEYVVVKDKPPDILIENNSSMSEELWIRIKSIKNSIFPQTMLTITLIGALYIFYFGYVASNVNNSDFAYSWISLPFFILCYLHHIWTLKVKNESFKMQIGVIKDLPSNS